MFTTENPPSDPPCPNNIRTDEKASDDTNNQLEVVDLLESGLDDNNNCPLPNFSIRDYVFSTRSKDIQINWPFSLKILQLCLKHGVKDVLPPFQSLDSVRNPSAAKSSVSEVKNFGLTDCVSSDSIKSNDVGEEIAANIQNINSNGSEENNKEFPSTRTNQFCSNVNSVSPVKGSCLEPDPENLTRSSPGNSEFSAPVVHKVQSSIQNQSSVKKCGLIVKLSNISEPKLNKDSAMNSSVLSETMASKVCPVCKTFSSTSNTTLNAHIDQCLSGGSTVKWTSNPKVIKHRIRPRKTRLMVDVYATALRCTLEDLDRRNGTNWASNFGLQAHQDPKASAEEKGKSKMHYTCSNEDNEENAVYIDSNGTKVRILSKFNDLPSCSNAKDDHGPAKDVKGDKGNYLFLSKKKKNLSRRPEIVRVAACGQQNFPSRPDLCSEVVDVRGKHCTVDNTNEDQMRSLKASDHPKADDLGMIKQWVGSKRTGLKKKFIAVRENMHADQTVENLRIMRNLSLEGDGFNRGTTGSNSPISDGNSLFSAESRKGKEKMSCDSNDECVEKIGMRKRPGFSSLTSQECHSNDNIKYSRRDDPSFDECYVDPPNDTVDRVCSRIKKVSINMSPVLNPDGSFISSKSGPHSSSSGGKMASLLKKPLDRAIPAGGKKFSSSRNNLLSAGHETVHGSKKKLRRKVSDIKKHRLPERSDSDSDKAVVMSRSVINRENTMENPSTQVEKDSGNSSMNGTRVLRDRKKRAGFVYANKGGDMVLMDSAYLECNNRSVSTHHSLGAVNEHDVEKEYSSEPISDGEALMAFSKSLDSTFPGFAGPSNVDSLHYMKSYDGSDVLGGEHEMYCSDNVDKDFTIPSDDMVTGLDVDDGQGNYFVDVDPIPIPGPPGSFLPSPGRLGSEELPGNSSLTSCKLHSSEDEHEQVEMDSSDSPLSAASMVSNSVPARSDSVSFRNSTVQSRDVKHKTSHQKGNSEERVHPPAEDSTLFGQASFAQGEKGVLDESKANAHELIFSSGQSCCCSRKEGVLQNDPSSYQDSQLLGRRSTTPLQLSVKEKQIGAAGNYNNLRISNMRLETVADKTTSGSEKSMGNSAMRHDPISTSQNSEACDFESPSTPNPVLRLMGKNLMVVKKDENLSAQTTPTQSSTINDHQSMHLHTDRHTISSGPVDNKHSIKAQLMDFPSPDGFRVLRNVRMPQCPQYPSTVVIPSERSGGSFVSSLDCREYAGGCSLPSHPFFPSSMRLDALTRRDINKARIPHPGPSASSGKEIIVIDDSPEREREESLGITSLKHGQAVQAGVVSASMAFGYDPMHLSSNFYSHQSWGYPLPNGTRMMQNPNNIQIPPSNGILHCNPQVSSLVQHPNSLTASSPASFTGHLRSPLYFSPGFPRPASFT